MGQDGHDGGAGRCRSGRGGGVTAIACAKRAAGLRPSAPRVHRSQQRLPRGG